MSELAKEKALLPDQNELTSRYGSLIENRGLQRIQNWALPNSADETDEERVLRNVKDAGEMAEYVDFLGEMFSRNQRK